MSKLPAHILFDIFSRLPPNTIGHCRCVYKTWFNLLLDPHFVNLHLSKSPSCLMINEYKGQQSTTLKLFEIDDEPYHHRVHREPAITLQHGVGEKLSYKVQSMGYFASGNSMITTILTYSIQFCEKLGGCLCICDNSSDSELVIWVMKEYGVKESWTKEIVISRNYIPDWVGYEAVRPFKILKDGSILMLWRDDSLITYCPRTKAFEELDIGMSNYDTKYEAVNYVPSILSLKNIVLEKV
ncbi:hypothetical protein LguiB_002664 [Lonicera macranthoides]